MVTKQAFLFGIRRLYPAKKSSYIDLPKCKKSKMKSTNPLTVNFISSTLEISSGVAKTTLRRLEYKILYQENSIKMVGEVGPDMS